MVYAEQINYWQTSRKQAETWIDDAIKLIKGIGGVILSSVSATDQNGRAGFMLEFKIGADQYKLIWQALPSKTKNDRAARVQAATLLFHDVKHKVVMAKVKGVRVAFLEYLQLPSGQTVGELAKVTEPYDDNKIAREFLLTSGSK